MNPNSVTKHNSPAVAAPCATPTPRATRRIVATRSDSAPRRTRPAASRRRCWRTRPLASTAKQIGLLRASAFTTMTPSTLSWTTFDVADQALSTRRAALVRRWYTTLTPVIAGKSKSATTPAPSAGREHPHRRDHGEHHRAARVRQRAEHLRRRLGVGLHVRERLTVGSSRRRKRLVLIAVDDSSAKITATPICVRPTLSRRAPTTCAHGYDDDQRDDASFQRPRRRRPHRRERA